MRIKWRLVVILCGTFSASPGLSQEKSATTWSPKAAAQYLDGRAQWWLQWSGAARGQGTACLSCHTSMPFALARSALSGKLGEATASAAEQTMIDNLRKRVENWEQIVADSSSTKDAFVPFYRNNRKPSALGTESVLNALVLVNHDARRARGVLSESSKKALAHLWEQQQQNGAWLWLEFGLRPWEKDAAYFGAALAAVAVGTAGKDYYTRADVAPKAAALKGYLKNQFAQQPFHDRVLTLWASANLPGILRDQDKEQLIGELMKIQEADGGWSLTKLGRRPMETSEWKAHGRHPDGGTSDGYATGLVVLALRHAGVAAQNAQLKKGLDWLATQQRDGAWPANYMNKMRDPQDNIGKFMRDAATAFAVLALTFDD